MVALLFGRIRTRIGAEYYRKFPVDFIPVKFNACLQTSRSFVSYPRKEQRDQGAS